MIVDGHGIEVDAPQGWEVRITRVEDDLEGASGFPVMHAASFALPEERGDYGSGAVELMGDDDVFVSLLEFGAEAVDSALFPAGEVPRELDSGEFRSNGMQRWISGQSAYQRFFTEGGRAFCLYIVIGSNSDRVALARKAQVLVQTITVEPAGPPGEVP
jgi:hypothetical protein